MTTCKNEKSISLLPSESISKAKYNTIQSLQSVPLTQKDAKAFENPNPVTEESHKDTKYNPQIKHLSNSGVTSVSNMCSLPSKTPLILPVTASSTLTENELHSRSLLPIHTIAQTSTTLSTLNKHSYSRESQNISENVKFTSEIIPNNISVNVPTVHTSVTLVPNSSQMPFPAKSTDYISPCSIAVGTDISVKKTNQSGTHFSSVNLVSKMSSPVCKQLSKSDKKDFIRVIQAKAGVVEIPSKCSFPVTSAKAVCCSSEEVNTLVASNSSFAKNVDTNLVSISTVNSAVSFCTPAIKTNTSAIASTAKCNLESVTHTFLTSTTSSTTFSTSVASCTLSGSTCAPIICPDMVTGSLTAASCTPTSAALCFSSLSTDTFPTTYSSVSCANLPLTIPCSSSTSILTSGIASNSHITTSLTTNTTSTSAITSIQSSKKEYEIMNNKSDVNNSKNVVKKHSFTCFQDQNLFTNVTKSHTGISHFIGGQTSTVQNANKQNQYLLTPAIMQPLLPIGTESGTDSKTQDVREISSSLVENEASTSIVKTEVPTLVGIEAPTTIVETEAPSIIDRTETPSIIDRTETPSTINGTETPSTINETETPSTINDTETPSTINDTETPSMIDGIETTSPSLNQFVSLAPDESFVNVIKPSSDKKVSGFKSPSDQLSKNVLTRIETNINSSVKQCSPTRIMETSDSMTTVSSSTDKNVSFSGQKPAPVSMPGTAVSVVGDIMKKNLAGKNTSSGVPSVNSDKSELVPIRKKLLKKTKSPEKESKSHTVSKTCMSSNSALSPATSKEDLVCSDVHNLSTSYPKFTSVLKNNSTISLNEKNKSLISTVNTAVSTKASTPTKTEGCSISTRPPKNNKKPGTCFLHLLIQQVL